MSNTNVDVDTKPQPKTVDLTPSAEGFRVIKRALLEGIEGRKKIAETASMYESELADFFEEHEAMPWELQNALEGALDNFYESNSMSITEMADSVAELERCGY